MLDEKALFELQANILSTIPGSVDEARKWFPKICHLIAGRYLWLLLLFEARCRVWPTHVQYRPCICTASEDLRSGSVQ